MPNKSNKKKRDLNYENNFFLSYSNDAVEEPAANQNEIVAANDAEQSNMDLIQEDKEIDSPNHNFKSRLISLNYFDDDNIDSNVISELTINTTDAYSKSEHLFLNEKDIIRTVPRRCFKDEGHFIGTSDDWINLKHLSGSVESVWNCLKGEDLLINNKKNDFDIVETEKYEQLTALTQNVPPIMFDPSRCKNKTTEQFSMHSLDDMEVLNFSFKQIKFNHHPLFSIEHILQRNIDKNYKLYSERIEKGTLVKLEDELASLRAKKEIIKDEFRVTDENNDKKIFNNEDFKKTVKKIKRNREMRISEASENKKLQKAILSAWKVIKSIRKINNYINTRTNIDVQKIYDDDDDDTEVWNKRIDCELLDVIDELTLEYYEKKEKYKLRKSADKKKSIKPILDYDEEELRDTLLKEFAKAYKKPEEPKIVLKLNNKSDVTKDIRVQEEMNRRKAVDKISLYFKIFINNKEVCKTVSTPLGNDFVINLNESFKVHMKENVCILKISIFEKHFLSTVNFCDITIPISKQDGNRPIIASNIHTFKSDKKEYSMSKFGCGNGVTLRDLISKEHPEMQITNVANIDDILNYNGELNVDIKWDVQAKNDTSNTIERIERSNLSYEMLKKLFETTMDPNDPQNALILKYFGDISFDNTKTEFYLNSDLYLNFDSNKLLNSQKEHFIKLMNEKWRKNRDKILGAEGVKRSDLSTADATTNQIDKHRQNSVNYLQSINNYLVNHFQKDNEKTVFDILKNITYPSLRSITLDIFNPKKSLFHQSKEQSPVVRTVHSKKKEYILKICIFKAFHLPIRQNNNSNDNKDEELLKLVTLRPFVHIDCQGQSIRTGTAIGNSPTWNEQMMFSVRYNPTSSITFHLFDEIVENWLDDDRLEDSTVHYHYSIQWLASLKIPLANVFNQNKIEGTFLMCCPIDLLGYKYNYDEKYPNPRISFDNLKRDSLLKQKEDVYMSMYMEVFPSYSDTIPTSIDERLNSNEIDLTLQHLLCFNENYKNQFPSRKLFLLVLDSSGRNACFTRFFQSVDLYDIGECFRRIFPMEQKDSGSSKSSTPFRKKSVKSQDIEDSQTIHSVLSINTDLDKRRQSRAIKDTFEMKSITENTIDNDDIPLMTKMQICMRYVSLMPTYKGLPTQNQLVALSPYQTLKLAYGSMVDHTILLMGYFISLGIECWCIAGSGLPYGFSTYVLIREDISKSEISLKSAIKTERKSLFNLKMNWKYYIIDATTGVKYDAKNPFCPMQHVHFICNDENIWANVQNDDRCDLTQFNLMNTSDWRPVFQKGSFISSPGPLSGALYLNDECSIYNHDMESAKQLCSILEDRIKTKVQKWRGHRKTVWNRHCSKILQESLVSWEKWSLNGSLPKPKYNSHMQQLLLSYQIYGFPLNLSYTTIGDIVSAVKGTQLHLNEHSSVEFALGIEVFSYPNFVYSVWIFFTSIIKK